MSKRHQQLETFRGLDGASIEHEIAERRKQLFQLRVQQMTGEVANHRQLRILKREIARLKTVSNEVPGGHEEAHE